VPKLGFISHAIWGRSGTAVAPPEAVLLGFSCQAITPRLSAAVQGFWCLTASTHGGLEPGINDFEVGRRVMRAGRGPCEWLPSG